MGNLCDCLGPGNQSDNQPGVARYNASEATPLLKGGPSKPAGPASARTQAVKPRKKTGNALDDLEPVEMKDCNLTSINKRFKDHTKLFNNILAKRTSLVGEIAAIKTVVPPDKETATLQECFTEIKRQCDEVPTSVSLVRKYKYCMEIEFNSKDLSASEHIVRAFTHFNDANRIVKDILEKSSSVADSIQLVVKDEDGFRRDILTASLGAAGPQCLKNCNENITELRKLPGVIESILKDTERIFNVLKDGVQPLLSES